MNFVNGDWTNKFKKSRGYFIVLILTALACMTVSGTAYSQDSIILKSVFPFQPTSVMSKPLVMFKDIVEQQTKGRVKIDIRGGDEVIPSMQQFDALRNNVLDVIFGITSFYTGAVPEGLALLYTKQTQEEQRKSGLHDLMRKIHLEKAGVVYLGFAGGLPGKAFRMYFSKSVAKPDFTGLKVRVSPVYTALVKALNGTPVMIPSAETPMALERGVVDGLGYTYGGLIERGLADYVKFVIDHPFYTQNSDIIFNRKTWDSLSADLKGQLEAAMIEFQNKNVRYSESYLDSEDAKLKSKGLQFIRFSPEVAKMYTDTAYKVGWENYLKKNPKNGPAIKAAAEK